MKRFRLTKLHGVIITFMVLGTITVLLPWKTIAVFQINKILSSYSLSLHVGSLSFSPLSGFTIKSLSLTQICEEKPSTIFSFNSFRVHYQSKYFLLKKIVINEILLQAPKLYIDEKNYTCLLKSFPKQEKEKIQEPFIFKSFILPSVEIKKIAVQSGNADLAIPTKSSTITVFLPDIEIYGSGNISDHFELFFRLLKKGASPQVIIKNSMQSVSVDFEMEFQNVIHKNNITSSLTIDMLALNQRKIDSTAADSIFQKIDEQQVIPIQLNMLHHFSLQTGTSTLAALSLRSHRDTILTVEGKTRLSIFPYHFHYQLKKFNVTKELLSVASIFLKDKYLEGEHIQAEAEIKGRFPVSNIKDFTHVSADLTLEKIQYRDSILSLQNVSGNSKLYFLPMQNHIEFFHNTNMSSFRIEKNTDVFLKNLSIDFTTNISHSSFLIKMEKGDIGLPDKKRVLVDSFVFHLPIDIPSLSIDEVSNIAGKDRKNIIQWLLQKTHLAFLPKLSVKRIKTDNITVHDCMNTIKFTPFSSLLGEGNISCASIISNEIQAENFTYGFRLETEKPYGVLIDDQNLSLQLHPFHFDGSLSLKGMILKKFNIIIDSQQKLIVYFSDIPAKINNIQPEKIDFSFYIPSFEIKTGTATLSLSSNITGNFTLKSKELNIDPKSYLKIHEILQISSQLNYQSNLAYKTTLSLNIFDMQKLQKMVLFFGSSWMSKDLQLKIPIFSSGNLSIFSQAESKRNKTDISFDVHASDISAIQRQLKIDVNDISFDGIIRASIPSFSNFDMNLLRFSVTSTVSVPSLHINDNKISVHNNKLSFYLDQQESKQNITANFYTNFQKPSFMDTPNFPIELAVKARHRNGLLSIQSLSLSLRSLNIISLLSGDISYFQNSFHDSQLQLKIFADDLSLLSRYFLKDIQATGKSSLILNYHPKKQDNAEIESELRFDEVSVYLQKNSLSFHNLNGSMKMKQAIWIDPKDFKNVQVVLIDRETFHRLDAEEKYSDIFQTVLPALFLKKFQYKDFSAENIYFTPSYSHGLFQLKNIRAHTLNGGVSGSIMAALVNSPDIITSLHLQFTNLDLSLLSGLKSSEESQLGGSLKLFLALRNRDVEGHIRFDTMGSKLLDRMLNALDPEGVNDSIQTNRKFLSVVEAAGLHPSLVHFWIEHSLYNLDLEIGVPFWPLWPPQRLMQWTLATTLDQLYLKQLSKIRKQSFGNIIDRYISPELQLDSFSKYIHFKNE